ncbi:hypothetical protein F5877DRAFT_72550 [Lentinula edodes]|nr:hypothetical protein F5877DRAFT_72550 [Lentinula edodes]
MARMSENYAVAASSMFGAILDLPGNGTNRQFVLDVWSTPLQSGVPTTGSPFQDLSRCILAIENENDVDQYAQNQLAIPFVALGYDIFIFLLTAFKTLKQALAMRKLAQSSITQVIIRDAIIEAIFELECFEIMAPFFDIMLGNIGAPLDDGSLDNEYVEELEEIEDKSYDYPKFMVIPSPVFIIRWKVVDRNQFAIAGDQPISSKELMFDASHIELS